MLPASGRYVYFLNKEQLNTTSEENNESFRFTLYIAETGTEVAPKRTRHFHECQTEFPVKSERSILRKLADTADVKEQYSDNNRR